MTATETFPVFIIGRDTRAAGRLFRLLAGLAGLGLLGHRLAGASAAEIGLVAAFAVLLAAAYTVLWRLLMSRVIGRVSPWVTSALLLLPLLAYGADPGGSAFFNGAAGYQSISLIVNAVSGYGGLEVAAIPVLVWRRRCPTYSPFNTVDLLERACHERPGGVGAAVAAAVSAAISVLVFTAYWLVPLFASYVPAFAAFAERLPGAAALALLIPAALFGYAALRPRTRAVPEGLGAEDGDEAPRGRTRRFDRVQGTAAGVALLLTPAFVLLSEQGGGPQGVLWGLITLIGLGVGAAALSRRLFGGRAAGKNAEPSRLSQ
ncbi:DUF6410 domain-containing protein [Nonomuraea sp. NPDC050643]|uniref:DUF6410 domain-containing protein n=1 Tax=Nonomuraea sp. NPDC050643 TaxID=3155660 RepID=UPI0034040592